MDWQKVTAADLPALPWPWLLAAALVLYVGFRLSRWWSDLQRARAGRKAQRDGRKSEAQAALWLGKRGYQVLEFQPKAKYLVRVDGKPQAVEVSADMRVFDGSREWIVEVKTAEKGSRVANRETRRQILEYQLAFRTPGVLLVDPVKRRLEKVLFPFAPSDQGLGATRLRWSLAGAVALALAYAYLKHAS